MKNILKLSLALASSVIALALGGCGGDSGSSTGPASGDSFAGTSMSFNPTVNFSSGGNLTYFNDEAGSPFPPADPAASGTYTYVPNASYTAGTLTMTVDGVQDPIVLEISNFTRTGPNVTGFTARSGGQSYPVSVTGPLLAYQRPGGGGGGGSGETSAADIPEGMRGTHELSYYEAATGSGIVNDSTETFTIGARTLAFAGKTLTNPVFLNGNTLEWIFKDGNLWYAVSKNNLGGLNEINVAGSGGTPFYGQYSDESNSGGDGGVSVDGDGKFAPGSVFYANLSNKVGPDTVPSTPHLSTPAIPESGALKFEIANNGDLIVGNNLMVVPFSAADLISVSYVQVLAGSPMGSNTITIHKNTTTNEPTNVSIYIVRNQVTPSVKTTQVTYTFTPIPTE